MSFSIFQRKRGKRRSQRKGEDAAMPVTTRRAARRRDETVVEEGVGAAHTVVDISSNSDTGPESASEESGSDEDYMDVSDCIDISDSDEDCIAISDSDTDDDEEVSCTRNVEEKEQSGVDGRDSHMKIDDLLSRGRNLDGIKLTECRAYLIQNGLSQTGDKTICVERIMLHSRFKHEDPEKNYPRSSFCINCKGDVCRGDAVLFKQDVYEKSEKKHSKCIGKRIVAGKVIKESYGEKKQQHTFTVQVFWSKGVGKLQPLSLLLIKGRNLYRMMTFRQPWPNEAERLKILEEKHNRGDAARRFRALNKAYPGRHVLNDNKLMGKVKHRQPGGASKITKCKNQVVQSSNSNKPTKKTRKEEHLVSSENDQRAKRKCASQKKAMEDGKHQLSDGGSKITKGKKRVMQSSHSDMPTKIPRKQEHLVSSENSSRAKRNCDALEKNICTSSNSSLCNDNSETNGVTLQRNSHVAPVNHAHFEGRWISSASQMQPNPENLAGLQQPPILREVGNTWQPRNDGQSIACPNPARAFQHPNAALANWRAPAYFRFPTPVNYAHFEGRHESSASQLQPNHGNLAGIQQPSFEMPRQTPLSREVGNAWQPPLNPPGVFLPPFYRPQTTYLPRPQGAYVMPEFRYSGGSNVFYR